MKGVDSENLGLKQSYASYELLAPRNVCLRMIVRPDMRSTYMVDRTSCKNQIQKTSPLWRQVPTFRFETTFLLLRHSLAQVSASTFPPVCGHNMAELVFTRVYCGTW